MAYDGSGKFDSALAERLWDISLDGFHDEEAGSVDTMGWFARFSAPTPGQTINRNGHTLTYRGPAGFILSTDSQGFVGAETYDDAVTFEGAWAEIVAADTADVCDTCGSTDIPCWCGQ